MIGLDDPFGNLITNVPGEDFQKLGYGFGDKVAVQIDKKSFAARYAKTFSGCAGRPAVAVYRFARASGHRTQSGGFRSQQ